ncbi:MAG TPA: sulfotransferase [Solirubrobacterales bacterium]|nr:sulfotransferase [Solirubrobacterales bacterium]
MATTPILLLSLPRSGSTLVQRVLGSHEEVATASEPWLLLPLLLPLRDDVPAAGGWQPRIHTALADFSRELPGGVGTYERSVGAAARSIYDEAAQGAPFYLDKTPPYFLVIDEISRALPEARIVILWRNPLAVLASVVETFCGGRWRPQDYPTSLFGGLARLVEGARRHGDRIHAVRYEDLVGGDDREWRRLTEFIGFEFDPDSLQRFQAVSLNGAMGDAVGTRAYSRVETEPTAKWRRTISNPVRRLWARRYLEWIGADRLATMGYDLDVLRRELATTETSLAGSGRDAAAALASIGRDVVKARVGGSGPSAWSSLWRPSRNGSRS